MKHFIPLILALLFIQSLKAEITPNELGKIFILTYHKIGPENTNFTRRYDSFKEDLELIKNSGFSPIRVDDFLKGKINAPKGKKPIIITFDDSSISQFEMKQDGKITSNSAVGMMESFKKKYPDFPMTAIFFITPGSKSPNNLFGQNEFTKKKVEFLLSHNYEIGNHTLWHANLNQFRHLISEQLAGCQRELNKFLPDFKIYAMATPYGSFPPERYNYQLVEGSYKGIHYKNDIIFDYSNKLSFSPFDSRFNIHRVHRIHGFESNIKKIVRKLSNSQDAFVSDGDPETVTIRSQDAQFLSTSAKKKFKIVKINQ